MKVVLKVLKILLFTLVLGLIFIICGLVYFFIVNQGVYLDTSKLTKNTLVYEFYDANNTLFYKQNGKNGENYVELSTLNDYTINAFISIEDKRFYSHNGIDVKRILGAILSNVKALKIKEGASTISQQLIKNTHLSSEKTLKRKLNEIYLTMQLENRYTKNEILEIYLNTIYFGGGAYGINDASKLYFNKNASDLTLNESATLAGLIKAPNTYSPIQSYENAFKRKNTVLKTMYDNEYIDKPLYNATLKEEIKLVESKNNNYIYPYVKATLNEFNSKVLVNPYVSGTVKIYTYLDLSLQNYVYNLSANANYKYSRQQIVKNNKNNGIIAYFGENSNIERSPASCIKPWYVYAPLINEKLITESTVIIDEETNFNGYTPKNYANKYYGAVTTKTAISKSLNVPSVKLLSNYGFEIANEYANKLNVQVNGDNLAVALGATNKGVTLKKLADTYTVFANNGNYLESSFINKVSINNTPIYERNLNFNKVFSDETAYIISDTLNDSVLNGTSKKLYDKNYKIYAKTGTNGNENGNLDAYTICYTSEHTVAVWLGNYDNSLMDNAITGGTYPAVYTKYTLDYLYKNNYPTQIELPSGIVSVNINENELLNNQTELIDNENGVNFYYIKGTEPTKYKNSEITPKIKNAVIKVSNNTVSINLESENANEFIINRCCNKNKTTFNATTFSFFDEKLNNGIYYYEITPVFNNNGNKILGKPYVTPSIKINKTIVNDWWKE